MRLRIASLLSVLAVVLLFAATPAFAANEIAYQCDTDVCLLDPVNPGAVTNLTDNGSTSYDEKPIWSPDGKRSPSSATSPNPGMAKGTCS